MRIRSIRIGRVKGFVLSAAAILTLSLAAAGQESDMTATVTPPQAADQPAGPLVDDINGITLNMTAEQVRDKLGKPDAGDASMMYYDLDGGQQLQLRLDADKKVTMVAGIYSGKKIDAPEFTEVLGSEAPTPENGRIYKLVRYPSAGYWVAYSRIDLDSGPMTTVTIQKLDK